jgi:hypothetical protein
MDIYDFATNTWSVGTAGGTARAFMGMAAYQNKIYAWGGQTVLTVGAQINTLDIYDIATNSWTTGATGGIARSSHSTILHNGKLYMYGGINTSSTTIGSVDVYDITTNIWTTGVTGPSRNSHTAFVYNNSMYVYGGSSSVLDVYSFGTNDIALSLLTGTTQTTRISTTGDAYFAGSISNGSLNIKSNGDLEVANGATRNIVTTTGRNLVQITDIATNFGATVESGALISRNSYEGEEFQRERADVTADTVNAWGDTQAWTADEQTATTNDCVYSVVNNAVNGIGRMTNTQANTTCLAYNGSAVGTLHTTYAAANLPVVIMKVRPNRVSANDDLWVGLQGSIVSTATDPTSGIYFTNNNTNVWTGVTRNASVSTNITCTGATISTTQFALLKIEVRSTTDVRFYVDNDVSNGVSWVSCGTSATNIPAAALASVFKWSSTTVTGNLDIDYFRAWQDDSADGSVVAESTTTEPEVLVTAAQNSTTTPTASEVTPVLSGPIMSAPTTPAVEAIDYLKIVEETTGLKYLSNADAKELKLTPSLGLTNVIFNVQKVTFTSNINVAGTVEVGGDLIVTGNAKVTGELYLGDKNFGTAKIVKGETEVEVKFDPAKSTVPFITVNPTSDSSVRYWISSKDVNGFTIKIESAQESDVEFEWIVINKL